MKTSSRVKFETVAAPRSVAPAQVSSEGRGRPVADLVEYFERVDSKFGERYGVSSAALRAGDLIRTMRKAAGLSQAELAKRMSATVTQARISELEAGIGRQGPTWDVMERIATACGKRLGLLERPYALGKDSAPAPKVAAARDIQNQGRTGEPAATERKVADALVSVEKKLVGARNAFARAEAAATEITAVLEPIYSTASRAMVEVNTRGLDALLATARANFAFVEAILGAKTVSDIARVQNELIRKQVEAVSGGAKESEARTKQVASSHRAAARTHRE